MSHELKDRFNEAKQILIEFLALNEEAPKKARDFLEKERSEQQWIGETLNPKSETKEIG